MEAHSNTRMIHYDLSNINITQLALSEIMDHDDSKRDIEISNAAINTKIWRLLNRHLSNAVQDSTNSFRTFTMS